MTGPFVAGLFPGQGALSSGMSSAVIAESEYTRELFLKASKYLSTDLISLAARGPDKTLLLSRYLQPAIVALSLGLLHEFTMRGGKLSVVAGHSLGEISAMAASGVITQDQAIAFSIERGIRMDEAAKACGGGGMLAVLFVPVKKVAEIVAEIAHEHQVYFVNDNAPEHSAVSGTTEALAFFAEKMRKEGIGKIQKIPVSGPWHSPLLTQAAQSYAAWVKDEPFKTPSIPLILNATGEPTDSAAAIKSYHINQLMHPVYWQKSMSCIQSMNVNALVEIGPGRMLCGLARVNGFKRGAPVHSLATVAAAEVVADSTRS